MRFVREGVVTSAALLLLSVYLYSAGFSFYPVVAALSAFILFFYRDPVRVFHGDAKMVLASADGLVRSVEDVKEFVFLNEECVRVSVFLSPFDMHINLSPIAGIIGETKRISGGFLPAFMPAAEKNKRNFILIRSEQNVPVVVMQGVGILARRIACWVSGGDRVDRAGKLGMIRFGSRTDVYVPKRSVAEVLVKKGEKVYAGKTAIMRLK